MEFQEFPKMARLTRDCIITEKIDGTNAQVFVGEIDGSQRDDYPPYVARVGNLFIAAGSRTRYITPEADNFGFAKWVKDHAEELAQLGTGRHYGEWWGQGIQRGYGLTEKRFSLFNTSRWADVRDAIGRGQLPDDKQDVAPACCHVVPVLYHGLFGPKHADNFIEKLRAEGSVAAPGFMKPEGVVVYHVAAGVGFKKTIEKDEQPKSKAVA